MNIKFQIIKIFINFDASNIIFKEIKCNKK